MQPQPHPQPQDEETGGDLSNFSYFLRFLMRRKRLTSQALAASMDWAISYVQGLVTGQQPPPPPDRIERLVRIMRCDRAEGQILRFFADPLVSYVDLRELIEHKDEEIVHLKAALARHGVNFARGSAAAAAAGKGGADTGSSSLPPAALASATGSMPSHAAAPATGGGGGAATGTGTGAGAGGSGAASASAERPAAVRTVGEDTAEMSASETQFMVEAARLRQRKGELDRAVQAAFDAPLVSQAVRMPGADAPGHGHGAAHGAASGHGPAPAQAHPPAHAGSHARGTGDAAELARVLEAGGDRSSFLEPIERAFLAWLIRSGEISRLLDVFRAAGWREDGAP